MHAYSLNSISLTGRPMYPAARRVTVRALILPIPTPRPKVSHVSEDLRALRTSD